MKIRSKLCTLMLVITFMPSLALAVQEVFSGIPLLGTEQVPPNAELLTSREIPCDWITS